MKSQFLLLLPALLFSTARCFAAGQYSVGLLPSPPDSYQAIGEGASSSAVVGDNISFDGTQLTSSPVLWRGGQVSPLPVPAGDEGAATGINSTGVAIGVARSAGSDSPLPAMWQNGQLQLLDTLGLSEGVPYGINSQGVVVGEVDGGLSGPAYAVTWTGGQATAIPGFTLAQSINNAGQILVNGQNGWAIWASGTFTPITPPTGASLNLRKINNLGDAVGGITSADGSESGGVLWSGGVATVLPALAGDTYSWADSLNDSDQVVGYSYNATNGIRAVLWENGQATDLNTLIPANSGWTLEEATDITDSGEIVGYGQHDGTVSAFELTPVASPSGSVPEPASLGVLALGALALLRRRRANRA